MQFVSTDSNHTAHMKAFIEQRHGLSLGTIIGLFLPDKDLNLLGKETADRGSTPCGENPHFLKRLPGQAYGHVLLGHSAVALIHGPSRIIRVARILRVVKYRVCGQDKLTRDSAFPEAGL